MHGYIWYSWLGYFGLLFGLIAGNILAYSLLRSALIGFAGGIAVMVAINILDPKPDLCLQNSKRWDILRAYSLKCPDPNARPPAPAPTKS
jgi:hypothetical protein